MAVTLAEDFKEFQRLYTCDNQSGNKTAVFSLPLVGITKGCGCLVTGVHVVRSLLVPFSGEDV